MRRTAWETRTQDERFFYRSGSALETRAPGIRDGRDYGACRLRRRARWEHRWTVAERGPTSRANGRDRSQARARGAPKIAKRAASVAPRQTPRRERWRRLRA